MKKILYVNKGNVQIKTDEGDVLFDSKVNEVVIEEDTATDIIEPVIRRVVSRELLSFGDIKVRYNQ